MPLFTKPSSLSRFTLARAADINERMDSVEAGFDNTQTALDLKLGAVDSIGDIPNSATRAGKALAFDVSGDPECIPYVSSADVAAAIAAAGAASVSAAAASGSASSASGSAGAASSSASAASGSASAASGSAGTATTQAGIATTQAGIATTKASEASGSAAAALASEGNALAYSLGAASAKTNAETAETNAETAEANAETAEANAETAATLAGEWATKAEDSAVTGYPGQYSALHWAAKAAAASVLSSIGVGDTSVAVTDTGSNGTVTVKTDNTTRLTVSNVGKITTAGAFFPDQLTDWSTIASATTCAIGGVASTFVNVTGTTTITSFGTPSAATFRVVLFSSALSISYNPTGMLLNGDSIAIQAGDILLLHYTAGTSGWVVVGGVRSGGGPVSRSIIATIFSAPEYDAGNSGTSLAINFYNGQNQKVTLTGNVTFTFSNPYSGMLAKVKLIQGSGPYTVTWPTIRWVGDTAPTISSTSGQEDIAVLYYDGTNYYGSLMANFGVP